ncbi:hypothetical protein GYMLUDRAFT_256204 [Collybiopsis luxurians FD-317 M1]|nr:hypothetical protein GYMLUDRAFT_256204 [Collybiopsis luxurians FD-317 M1]
MEVSRQSLDGSLARCHHKHANNRNRHPTFSKKQAHTEGDPFDNFDSLSEGRCNQNRRGSDRGANSSKQTPERPMQAQKQSISRHRAAWGRAVTLPGYGEIGFLDTQMAGDINERAK